MFDLILNHSCVHLLTQIRNKRKTTFCVVYKCSRTVYKPMNPFPTCSIPHVTLVFLASPRLSTPPGIQSAENTRDDDNSVSGSNPGSFIVMMQVPIATNRRCLHPAQHCSKSSKIIRRTLRCIPSYSKLIEPRSLTLFQGF